LELNWYWLAAFCTLTVITNSPANGASSVYREVKEIVVEEQAKADEGTDKLLCTPFRLTNVRIIQLLRMSREIDRRTYAHTLNAAPCSVTGSLKLRNGLTGRWQIEMSGRVYVKFEDDHIMLFDASDRKPPFVR
jgi:hypothetical protein